MQCSYIIISIITCENNHKQNFIDNLIVLINLNDYCYNLDKKDNKKKILDKLINITEIAIRANGSLVEDNKINQNTLTEIFNLIDDN